MDEERFLGGWTRTKLAARTPEERYDIWKRAKSLHTADGNQLAREIELIGLPDETPVLPEADILTHVISDIIRSEAGKSALKEATLDGLPAIAGADDLIHEALGAKYRRNDKAVSTAQRLVAGKRERSYTSLRYDVFESDATLQHAVAELYERFVEVGFLEVAGAPQPSVADLFGAAIQP